MKPKTSPVWKYFIAIDSSNARCKLCERVYSRKGRTTTALKSHLRAVHVENFNEFEKLDEAVKLCLEAKKNKIEAPVEDYISRSDYAISPASYDNLLESAYTVDTTTSTDSAITATSSRTPYRRISGAIKRCRDELSSFDARSFNEDMIPEEETAFGTFGRSVAMQLKNMSVESALLAQSRIQSILTEIGIADYRKKKTAVKLNNTMK